MKGQTEFTETIPISKNTLEQLRMLKKKYNVAVHNVLTEVVNEAFVAWAVSPQGRKHIGQTDTGFKEKENVDAEKKQEPGESPREASGKGDGRRKKGSSGG